MEGVKKEAEKREASFWRVEGRKGDRKIEAIVESLQSHIILTMSHWSSGLTCLLPATRVTGFNPLGGLM